MEMEMEPHATVSITKRQSQRTTTSQSLWRAPLSDRSELHSHMKAEGLEGPIATIVTTGMLQKTLGTVLNDAKCLSVSSQFVTIPCSMGYFKLTTLLDFETVPDMLVMLFWWRQLSVVRRSDVIVWFYDAAFPVSCVHECNTDIHGSIFVE